MWDVHRNTHTSASHNASTHRLAESPHSLQVSYPYSYLKGKIYINQQRSEEKD